MGYGFLTYFHPWGRRSPAMCIYRENSGQSAVGSEIWHIFIAGGGDIFMEHDLASCEGQR